MLRQRLYTLYAALGHSAVLRTADRIESVAHELEVGGSDHVWLALAVLTGELPDQMAVQRTRRATELDGPLAALASILSDCQHSASGKSGSPVGRVEVVTNQVVVDLDHTSGTSFATGIQRVAREVVRHWDRTHPIVLVGWTSGYTALRRLPPSAAEGVPKYPEFDEVADPDRGSIVVPWRSTYLLPELLGEPGRVDRFLALARHSGNHTAAIGYDCVPLTTGETVREGMGADFAHYLSAVAHTDRVATISEASAVEFRGWKAMLIGAGLTGPDIASIPLPMEHPSINDQVAAIARQEYVVADLPMVLVVGSHEPRKNHRAVLHAAELLWREGLTFSLLFVGGDSWNSDEFSARLHSLEAAGRPVRAVTAISDDLLWSVYQLATCTVFPSLNEGYGLPIAESIASGTPVVTSNFGSMREIAEPGGALLVDPHDDHDIARAIKRLLTDDALVASLARQSRDRPQRTWQKYSDETWAYLVDGVHPNRSETP